MKVSSGFHMSHVLYCYPPNMLTQFGPWQHFSLLRAAGHTYVLHSQRAKMTRQRVNLYYQKPHNCEPQLKVVPFVKPQPVTLPLPPGARPPLWKLRYSPILSPPTICRAYEGRLLRYLILSHHVNANICVYKNERSASCLTLPYFHQQTSIYSAFTPIQPYTSFPHYKITYLSFSMTTRVFIQIT